MTDLISRADAIEAVCRTRCGDKAKGCPAHSCLVIEEFDALPSAVCDDCIWHVCNYNKVDWDALPSSAEAVQVVRCKDCKHYIVEGITTQYGWCHEYKHSVNEDDFCSYGERRKP